MLKITVDYGGSRTEGFLKALFTNAEGFPRMILTDRDGNNAQEYPINEVKEINSCPVGLSLFEPSHEVDALRDKNRELEIQIKTLMEPHVKAAMMRPPAPVKIDITQADGIVQSLINGQSREISILKRCVWHYAFTNKSRSGSTDQKMLLEEVENIVNTGRDEVNNNSLKSYVDQPEFHNFQV
jgi:hypothetical protein